MARPENLRESLPGLRRVVRRFQDPIRDERRLALASSAALLAGVGFHVLEPWPLKFVFDRAFSGSGTTSLPGIGEVAAVPLLMACAAATVLFVGLRALSQYASSVGFALVGNRVLTRVREDVFRHVQTLSLAFDSRSRLGDLVTRMIGDVGILKEVVVTALLPLLSHVAVLVVMVAVMLFVDWQLALAALLPLPIFALFTARQSRRIQHVGRRQRHREGDLASRAAEMVGTLPVVQALSLQESFAQSFVAASRGELKHGVRGKRLAAGLERSVDLLIGISGALVLGFGGWRVLGEQITPGDLVLFLTYQRRVFRPIRDFAKYTARLAKATAAGERILELLDRSPEVVERPDAVAAPPMRGAVSFRRVRFGYAPGADVLSDVSLEIQPGETVALVGPSGAGKSSLVRLLLRLVDPVDGEIRIDGRDVRDFTLDSVRSQIGVVLQDAVLFAGTLRENIAFGATEASPERIEWAAAVARVDEFAGRLPEGYETRVGEAGATLSRGQRQRVAIARAAVRKAPILVLDEPMTGLDEANEKLVREALLGARRDRTCLLVTHDLLEAAQTDRIALLEGGRIVESGTHAELLRRRGRYAALFSKRSRWHEEAPEEESRAAAG